MAKFNGRAEFHVIEGNTGESFAERRKGHYGGSNSSVLVGDNEYATELEGVAELAGMVPDGTHSKFTQKIFAIGHIFENPTAEVCVEFMRIDYPQFEIELHPMDKFEWTNDEWPDALAHLDFIVEIKKGKVVPNPEFYVGCGKPNWKIVPDEEDHRYICDSKTCQDEFVPTWNKRDENGVRIGGLSNGVCSKPYYDQLHFYMMVCNIDGGFIFGTLGGTKVTNYATVFVPCDIEYGQALMDECQRKFEMAKAGKLPKAADCKNPTKAAIFLEKLYSNVNQNLRLKKLTNSKWTEPFEKVASIDEEMETIRAGVEKEAKAVKAAEAQLERLRQQKKALLLEPVEDIKDRKGCYYTDENGNNTYVIEYVQEMKWDYLTKEFFAEKAQELSAEFGIDNFYEEAERLFSQKKAKYTRHSAVKERYDDEEDEAEML